MSTRLANLNAVLSKNRVHWLATWCACRRPHFKSQIYSFYSELSFAALHRASYLRLSMVVVAVGAQKVGALEGNNNKCSF